MPLPYKSPSKSPSAPVRVVVTRNLGRRSGGDGADEIGGDGDGVREGDPRLGAAAEQEAASEEFPADLVSAAATVEGSGSFSGAAPAADEASASVCVAFFVSDDVDESSARGFGCRGDRASLRRCIRGSSPGLGFLASRSLL